MDQARGLISPLLEQRQRERSAAKLDATTPLYNDAIDWLDALASEKHLKYDPAASQLSLSTAALHSTTDFITQILLDIAGQADLIEELRDEIRSAQKGQGWSKSSLYDLKLMDSVMKESQRLKPISLGASPLLTSPGQDS